MECEQAGSQYPSASGMALALVEGGNWESDWCWVPSKSRRAGHHQSRVGKGVQFKRYLGSGIMEHIWWWIGRTLRRHQAVKDESRIPGLGAGGMVVFSPTQEKMKVEEGWLREKVLFFSVNWEEWKSSCAYLPARQRLAISSIQATALMYSFAQCLSSTCVRRCSGCLEIRQVMSQGNQTITPLTNNWTK